MTATTNTTSEPAWILVRFAGEVATKSSRVRARFQRRLAENLRDALRSAGVRHRLRPGWSRLFVETDDPAAALDASARVFGLSSLSPIAARCRADLDEIVRVAADRYAPRVRGRRFAVRARRAGDHPFRSKDIEVQLGAALLPHAKGVDLDRPEITVHVEVRGDTAYVFHEWVPGPGGLPLGVQGRGAVALLSGGFDSAVAAWRVLRRGVPVDYVFCNLADAAYERAVVQVAKHLADTWSYGTRPVLHVLDFGPIVDALRRDVRPNYVQVVLKRLLYRAAERIAEATGREAIVTGESIGQVSSQTLTNLRAIDEVAGLPVLRPLLAFDKEEIVAESRRIGTYALSSKIQEYCALVPDRPVTAAPPEAAAREEARLDPALLARAVEERRTLDLRSLDPSELVLPYVYVETIPEDAVVLDGRPGHAFEAARWPGSRHVDLDELLSEFTALDRGALYVLVCPLGLQSAVVAERMQRAGYRAYSLRGGARTLASLLEARGRAAADAAAPGAEAPGRP